MYENMWIYRHGSKKDALINSQKINIYIPEQAITNAGRE
jgi:hypothetical protein